MSTPTNTTSRKRKADDDDGSSSGRKLKLAKPSSSSSPAAHLPASCLAAILNFMEYGDVRRCLLAGKTMAVDAASHVETLNIMNASELVTSAARRFANVSEINILSLVTTTEDGDEDAEDTLSVGTATRSVPYLTSFPKLKRVFLGGLFRDPDDGKWIFFRYWHSSCREPEDHLTVFRGLVEHLCGAFQSRSLSPSLHLEGVLDVDQLVCRAYDEGDGRRCRRCWNAATFFPPSLVLHSVPKNNCLCLPYSDRIEALASRHENPFLTCPQAATESFLEFTETFFYSGFSVHSGDLITGEGYIENPFVKRIESQGGLVGTHGFDFYYISENNMKSLKRLSALVTPPVISSIPKSGLLSALSPLDEAIDDGKRRVLVRQTFEGLVELGFDLASKDFVLIDPLNEPVLEDYHHLFRSEEEAF